MPHGRGIAAGAGHGRHAGDGVVGRPAEETKRWSPRPTFSARTSAASSPAAGRRTPISDRWARLADMILAGGYEALAGVPADEILMRYDTK